MFNSRTPKPRSVPVMIVPHPCLGDVALESVSERAGSTQLRYYSDTRTKSVAWTCVNMFVPTRSEVNRTPNNVFCQNYNTGRFGVGAPLLLTRRWKQPLLALPSRIAKSILSGHVFYDNLSISSRITLLRKCILVLWSRFIISVVCIE